MSGMGTGGWGKPWEGWGGGLSPHCQQEIPNGRAVTFAAAPTRPPRLISPHGQPGAEAVHVDVPVLPQLLGKLWRQCCMMGRGEIAQCVPQSQL